MYIATWKDFLGREHTIPKGNLGGMETPETRVCSLGQEGALEVEMATTSSILAWGIPWTVEPVGLHSMGSQRVRLDLTTERECICVYIHIC